MRMHLSATILAALCLGTIASAAPATEITYTVKEIPSPQDPHGRPTVLAVTDLNEKGQVVGFIETANRPFLAEGGFITGPNAIGLHLLTGPSPQDRVAAIGVNDLGQVTGNFLRGNIFSQAFLTEPNGGTLHPIGPPGFHFNAWQADAVNNHGQITGQAPLANGQEAHAFLATSDGTFKDLGTLGGSLSLGNDINESGQVAGDSARNGITFFHAFLSEPDGGRLHDLGTLGGFFSSASAVNEAAQVVGISSVDRVTGTLHAFLSAPDGGLLLDLGTLGGSLSDALDINDLGIVVGFSSLVPGGEHAFIYSPTFGMQDLNDLINPDLGVELTGATAINNRGQIVAIGMVDGVRETFLLTPKTAVPDVGSTAMLFGCALAGLLLLRRCSRVKRIHEGSLD